MKGKFSSFRRHLLQVLSVKFRVKDGRNLVCITLLSIMKDFSSMDYTLVLANASRGYETFGNNIKKV